MLLAMIAPGQLSVHSQQSSPEARGTSQYMINRYGYVLLNETIVFSNRGNTTSAVPGFEIGFGNLTSKIASYNITGGGFRSETVSDGMYEIIAGQKLSAGGNLTFEMQALLNNVVTTASNGTLQVQVLVRPSVNLTLVSLMESVKMPASTTFATVPAGLSAVTVGGGVTYSATVDNVTSSVAQTQLKSIKQAPTQDFHPLVVYQAERVISVGSNTDPVVTDHIFFQNLGTTSLSLLYLSPLTGADSSVTVIPPPVPHLLNPTTVALSNYGLNLTTTVSIGTSISPRENFTLVIQYPLPQKYYASSGGVMTLTIPNSPPIPVFVDSYTVQFSLPAGYRVVKASPPVYTDVVPAPWGAGSLTMAYGLNVGWALSDGVPAASAIFVLLVIGLFVSRTSTTEEEETEEESSTESASAMIKAFDDKTSLINSIWPEVASADVNELNKAYFDEIRGRLDTFRNRSLQRLNEVKQKSTTQKFFDLLNQMHTTEREVDRAAKDKLNLFEQYYTKRMRKEVFDRLLPQYSKRLEKALNELSDELHVVQREAKLL